MKKTITAFVAGATGYTGREVIRLLCEKGVKAVAHIRPASPHLEKYQKKFKEMGAVVDTTPWQAEEIRWTLKQHQPDIVFSLLGTTKARMRALAKKGFDAKQASYENVDLRLTLLLLQAAEQCPKKPLFVYLSSLGVSERAWNQYLKVRFVAEEKIRESLLDYIIVRPSIITGIDRDDYRFFEYNSARVIDKVLDWGKNYGGQKLWQRYHSTTNTNLAAALIYLSLDPKNHNQIFESQQLREFV